MHIAQGCERLACEGRLVADQKEDPGVSLAPAQCDGTGLEPGQAGRSTDNENDPDPVSAIQETDDI